MNIIIEGPDGSGKSTLARYLADITGRVLVAGEGPSKYPGEINDRVRRYLALHEVVHDRHPCVSSQVYEQFKPAPNFVDQNLLFRFYQEPNVFIYCPGKAILDNHAGASDVDTPEYEKWLQENHASIYAAYKDWALDYAHVVYRIGDNMKDVYKLIRGMM